MKRLSPRRWRMGCSRTRSWAMAQARYTDDIYNEALGLWRHSLAHSLPLCLTLAVIHCSSLCAASGEPTPSTACTVVRVSRCLRNRDLRDPAREKADKVFGERLGATARDPSPPSASTPAASSTTSTTPTPWRTTPTLLLLRSQH